MRAYTNTLTATLSSGMAKPSGVKHANYEILNLIGYGLAKFEKDLVAALGFETKATLFNSLIRRGVATTVGTLKNRQDLFNPLVRDARVGWWQNKDRYLHRKLLLDSLFGDLNATDYASVITSYLQDSFPIPGEQRLAAAPLLKSKYRQLQETGREAELFFMTSYRTIARFKDGVLGDARLFGDGYDFQITVSGGHVLAEVKGVREGSGGVRLTENEYLKADEFKENYCLVVVSRLATTPRISVHFNPLAVLPFSRQVVVSEQVSYTTPARQWG